MAPALVTPLRRLAMCYARWLTFRRFHHYRSPAVPQALGLSAPHSRYSGRQSSRVDVRSCPPPIGQPPPSPPLLVVPSSPLGLNALATRPYHSGFPALAYPP
ncbi:hypothetical protein GUJ93_ZPchr0010g7437 [Zizania palustris]|uniref:Uncharacterized protein n=1 Tax=Zizania palustris TaxID=103762 RepID=A0A8J5W891_ZIZPA|nr:hypothetical protein GUJ93_ZPchr0010g7437 [Zizania palustris]